MSQTPYLLSEASSKLILSHVPEKHRFIITGATGWLGRTIVALLSRAGHQLFLVGSHPRLVVIDKREYRVHSLNLEAIEKFAPSVLIDLAFLTREHLESTSKAHYRLVNENLIRQAMELFSLPSVSYAMFTSSGAAVYPSDALLGTYSENPYGYLKRMTEDLAMYTSAKLGKKCVVIRPWSLSGTMVSKEYEFAFSSFVRQSFGKEINVKSRRPVQRRYVSAEDFLALSLAKLFANSDQSMVFDSGGELTSLVELARIVSNLQDHAVSVSSTRQTKEGLEDRYYSDNVQWKAECQLFDFEAETLVQQVSRNILYIKSNQSELDKEHPSA